MGIRHGTPPPISYVAKMGAGQCPCKDCQVRTEGCHGKCEAYGKWRTLHEEMRSDYLKKIKCACEAKDHYREAVNKAVAKRHRQYGK